MAHCPILLVIIEPPFCSLPCAMLFLLGVTCLQGTNEFQWSISIYNKIIGQHCEKTNKHIKITMKENLIISEFFVFFKKGMLAWVNNQTWNVDNSEMRIILQMIFLFSWLELNVYFMILSLLYFLIYIPSYLMLFLKIVDPWLSKSQTISIIILRHYLIFHCVDFGADGTMGMWSKIAGCLSRNHSSGLKQCSQPLYF